MKTALKWIAAVVLCLIAGIAGLFIGTQGDDTAAQLVTDDPSLPAMNINGIRLHMRIVNGPANAPTIIVLHGGPGGDFRSLQALEALSDQFQLVFYDQRGAGLSERVPQDLLTLDGHLEELKAVIDIVSPEQPPILIGHSWGAMLAAAFIGQNPDDVQSAILIEPGYLDAKGRTAWVTTGSTYMSGPTYWWQAVIAGFRTQHITGPDSAAQDDFLIGHMVGVFANHPDNPYHCGNGYTAPNWRFGALTSNVWRGAPDATVDRLGAQVRAFTGPVLLVTGSCNSWLGPLQSQFVARFADAGLAIIPDAGHDVVWDQPQATLSVIRRFLN
jgi:proline iminopeptidase